MKKSQEFFESFPTFFPTVYYLLMLWEEKN